MTNGQLAAQAPNNLLQGTISTAEYLSRHVEAAPKKLQHSQYWSQSGRDTWVEKARSLQSKYSDKLAAVMQKGVAFHHGGEALRSALQASARAAACKQQ